MRYVLRNDHFWATIEDGNRLWLGKFPEKGDRCNLQRVEYATLELARRCGIAVCNARLESVADHDVLMVERFDREYLLTVVDKDLFWIEKTRFPFSNPAWYLGQIDPDVYLSRDYAPLDVRLKAYIKYAQGIPKMAASIKENLKSPLPKTYVELGIEEFGGLADFYTKNVAAVFAAVSDADLQKQLKDADAAAGLLRELGSRQCLVDRRERDAGASAVRTDTRRWQRAAGPACPACAERPAIAAPSRADLRTAW